MSNNSSNKLNVPQAKQGMEQFKMQAANEVGVNLKQGCNGNLGKAQTVRKMCPIGRAKYERQSRTAVGHLQTAEYIAAVTIWQTPPLLRRGFCYGVGDGKDSKGR